MEKKKVEKVLTEAEVLTLVKNYAMTLGYKLTAEPTIAPDNLAIRHHGQRIVNDVLIFVGAIPKLNKI